MSPHLVNTAVTARMTMEFAAAMNPLTTVNAMTLFLAANAITLPIAMNAAKTLLLARNAKNLPPAATTMINIARTRHRTTAMTRLLTENAREMDEVAKRDNEVQFRNQTWNSYNPSDYTKLRPASYLTGSGSLASPFSFKPKGKAVSTTSIFQTHPALVTSNAGTTATDLASSSSASVASTSQADPPNVAGTSQGGAPLNNSGATGGRQQEDVEMGEIPLDQHGNPLPGLPAVTEEETADLEHEVS
ncbi:hypothetical protein DFH09DRAFT_1371575 [Mycena vulgaris]|nr:hypothetical protein DFH09DRAFT_1371575 [Mycena vulgaris]